MSVPVLSRLFDARYADFNFCFGKGVNTPTAFAPTAARMKQAAEQTGRDVGSYVLFMVIADETDDAARAKWEHYKAGADEEALSWLTEQSQKDTRSGTDTNVRQMADPTSAVNMQKKCISLNAKEHILYFTFSSIYNHIYIYAKSNTRLIISFVHVSLAFVLTLLVEVPSRSFTRFVHVRSCPFSFVRVLSRFVHVRSRFVHVSFTFVLVRSRSVHVFVLVKFAFIHVHSRFVHVRQ